MKDSLAISMPREVVKTLGIKEGDDIDFIQYKDSYYIIAKRSDIANLITGQKIKQQISQPLQKVPELSEAEIAVLKKLDTLRYSMRTTENVSKLLEKEERITFKQLEKKGVVTPFKDDQGKTHYSIQKMFYDKYLMRKKPQQAQEEQAPQKYKVSFDKSKVPANANAGAAAPGAIEKYVDELQKSGYVVVPTEPEAAAISASLEESIRRGLVIGTRAFNKKFYIVMRSFITSNTPVITSQIMDKSASVPTIAKACKLDEDAVRAVLYILAESGEVTEVRKDIFRIA